MPTTSETTVEREVVIAASPETVWEFLVDPEKATQWMGTSASLEAVAGGEYRVDVIPGNVARGEFVEVDKPRRLVITWGWEPGAVSQIAPGTTTVEYELIPDGEHTIVRVTNRDLPDADAAAGHGLGWEHYLQRLQVAGAGGDAGRDPWLDNPFS